MRMSQEHKDALAIGRNEGRAVRDYLSALRDHRPKRGRKRTPDTINQRLVAIEEALVDAEPIEELRMLQERRDLGIELLGMEENGDMSSYEQAFIAVAANYSVRNGISYATWREIGVPASVLRAAGVTRAAHDPE
jgi:hypothetical protein